MNRRFPINSYIHSCRLLSIIYSGMPGPCANFMREQNEMFSSHALKSKAFYENIDLVVHLIGKTTCKACTCNCAASSRAQ